MLDIVIELCRRHKKDAERKDRLKEKVAKIASGGVGAHHMVVLSRIVLRWDSSTTPTVFELCTEYRCRRLRDPLLLLHDGGILLLTRSLVEAVLS